MNVLFQNVPSTLKIPPILLRSSALAFLMRAAWISSTILNEKNEGRQFSATHA
ncbi:uncharacterized protein TrAtP1_001832 [Trichoderma atroviride]|uniref:uncharacterized protein n=1 Tax=Hypocrea atroviridis TaxID=63577 RepID=UPI00332068F4|nr:hypothetical protein TrAtP1_001832 [Trichoderma atroviride]